MPRKLDFDAPLLSTRRHTGAANNNNSDHTSRDGVPFSWERIPGEPKDVGEEMTDTDVPPPKLPPGRWQPPQETASYDNGCDGDVDDDFDNDNNEDCRRKDCSENAIDIFSLAESTEEDDKDKSEDNFVTSMDRKSAVVEPDEPNFIIQRFLPDAQALAAASVVHKNGSIDPNYYYPCMSRAVSVRRAYKGCGIGALFKWGLKPKPCSVKSPVQGKSLRVFNSQWHTKPK